jgi:hypothetical protein
MLRFPFILIGLLIQSSFSVAANEPMIFELVKKGDIQNLRTYLDTTKTSINVVNAKGYSPLHILIENYVEYRSDWRDKDAYKYQQSIERYELYRACLRLLLERGASPRQMTPEGWNALQFAVVKGKADAVDELLERSKGGDARDDEGNTLLHLSMLTKPEEPRSNFWQNLIHKLYSYNININTPNAAGQTPIAFYMSHPRCIANPEQPKPVGKLYGAGAATKAPECPSSATFDMLGVFMHQSTLETPDFSGNTAIGYAQIHNTWAVSRLEGYMESYRRVQAEWEPHLKKFAEQAEENKRLIKEYEARKAAEAQQGPTRSSGCRNYCSRCQGSGSGGEKAVQVECPVCYGRGVTGYSKSEIQGFVKDYTYYSAQTCYKCKGSGRRTVYELQFCGTCRGSGCAD